MDPDWVQQSVGLRRVLSMDSNAPWVVELPSVKIIVTTGGFEELYRLEYPGLVAVATAMTADNRDGEDLVQETMIKAFTNWDRVGRLELPGAWCHRVLINACRSRLRRRGTARRLLERVRPDEATAPGPSPDAIAFWGLVRKLPERPRTVVSLYYAGDRTTAEIAAILGCPEGTVRSDLSRARVVLTEQWGR